MNNYASSCQWRDVGLRLRVQVLLMKRADLTASIACADLEITLTYDL